MMEFYHFSVEIGKKNYFHGRWSVNSSCSCYLRLAPTETNYTFSMAIVLLGHKSDQKCLGVYGKANSWRKQDISRAQTGHNLSLASIQSTLEHGQQDLPGFNLPLMQEKMLLSNEEMLKKIDPLHYFEQFILEEVYPDGRDTMQFRPSSVEVSVDAGAYGSSYVQQSGACVSCTVDLTVAPNSDQSPIVYELKGLECIPKETLEETNTHFSKIIRGGFLLDSDTLLVDTSDDSKKINNSVKLRFILRLEIVVISADGFLLDAVLTAVQAALFDTRLPGISYTGKTILFDDSPDFDDIPLEFDISKLEIHPLSDNPDENRSIALKDFLVNTSFLLYKSPRQTKKFEYKLLCDPPAELCALIPGYGQITVGREGTIYEFSCISTDSIVIDEAMTAEIFSMAQRRHARIWSAIKQVQNARINGA